MANIFDYLDWRKDIPLTVDPFNEVDNLVLAELCYTDFEEGEIPEAGSAQTVTLEEANERYYSHHTEEDLLARTDFVRFSPLLMREMAGSVRFGGMRIGHFINIISAEADEQLCAMTFYLPDGTVYVAFRGTDNTVIGWKEDFDIAYMEQTAGQKHAAEYLSRCFAGFDGTLCVGGHSKGGNIAVYAAAFCGESVRDRITDVYSNDGPGFVTTVVESKEYQAVVPKVHSIIPEGSLFGLLMHGTFPHKIIHSDGRGVYQHDGLTWQVMGNHFVEAPEGLNDYSRFWQRTITNWVDGVAIEDRKEFLHTMFQMVDVAGADTVSELNENRFRNYTEIFRAMMNMNEAQQEAVWPVVGRLIRSGEQTLKENFSEWKAQAAEAIREKLSASAAHPEITERGGTGEPGSGEDATAKEERNQDQNAAASAAVSVEKKRLIDRLILEKPSGSDDIIRTVTAHLNAPAPATLSPTRSEKLGMRAAGLAQSGGIRAARIAQAGNARAAQIAQAGKDALAARRSAAAAEKQEAQEEQARSQTAQEALIRKVKAQEQAGVRQLIMGEDS